MDTYEGKVSIPVTLHKHIYVNGDPANYVDPTGNFGILSFGGLLFDTAIITSTKSKEAQIQVKNGNQIVKVLGCAFGVSHIKKQYIGDGLQGHHSVPKNVGGDPDQALIFLPSNTHHAFHWLLNVSLKGDKRLEGKGAWTSAENWQSITQTKAGRKLIYPHILRSSKFIDKLCKLKGPASLAKFVRRNRKAYLDGQ